MVNLGPNTTPIQFKEMNKFSSFSILPVMFLSMSLFLRCAPKQEKRIPPAKGQGIYGEWVSNEGEVLIICKDTCFSPWNDNFSTYVISGDSIFIKREYRNYGMRMKVANDTQLILSMKTSSKEYVYSFQRFAKLESLNAGFKSIRFNSSGCFGSCPIQNLELLSNGKFVYHGERFVHDTAIFKGAMPSSFIDQLLCFLKVCDWKVLKTSYSSNITDNPTLEFSLIEKDGSIHSLSDYAESSPPQPRAVLNFLFSISSLADVGYFKKEHMKQK
jgi:hypothetical protein